VRVVSISLDGATPTTHDGVRGVEGHFAETVTAVRRLRAGGLTVQVNTVVMRDTVEELPAIARIVKESGASIWEVFFLIRVGRGRDLGELTPAENEDVCHFLVDASRYGFIVRTVEAPFFRRVVALRKHDLDDAHVGATYDLGPLYERLAAALRAELGAPTSQPRAQTKGTRDGRGIVFVAHDGEINPSGFLPLLTRQRHARRHRQRLSRPPGAAPDPRGRLQRPLRSVLVPGALRRFARPRLRHLRRSARRRPGLRLPARLARGERQL